ncbi:MAG: alpha/beta hydrolase [Acidobacteria bacterium]|nr:alpha/beta hydrolase [Acidobacteriota bacterium]
MMAVLVAAGTLAAVFAGVRLFERSLAFFPLQGEGETPASFGVPFEAIDLTTADGERVHAWWLPHEPARATVLYLHGNGGHLSLWAPVLIGIWRQGYAVFAVDYRGYGRSTGRPSEAGLYLDVAAAAAAVHARGDRGPAPLVYWGRSLGAVMAARAARDRVPDGLVLEAGFPSVRAVLEGTPFWLLSWFSSYRFPASEFLADVRVPTLVIHGEADSVIPFRLGQRLFESVQGPRRFVAIPGGDHNDPQPADPGRYWTALQEFVRTLEAREVRSTPGSKHAGFDAHRVRRTPGSTHTGFDAHRVRRTPGSKHTRFEAHQVRRTGVRVRAEGGRCGKR